MSLSISIALDTRRAKKTGKLPVKLLAIFNHEPQRYQTIYDLSEEEFKKLSAKKKSECLLKVAEELKLLQRRAEEVGGNLRPFAFAAFEKVFMLNNPSFHQRKAIKEIAELENHPSTKLCMITVSLFSGCPSRNRTQSWQYFCFISANF